jgi:tryptophan synthase beta subunit
MMLTTLLSAVPRWVWVALVAALSATSCKLKYDKDGLSLELEKTRVVLEQERADYAVARANASELYAQTVEEYRTKEQALQAAATQARRERDVQVAAARRTADDLRERLFAAIEAPAGPDYPTSYTLAAVAGPRPFATGSFGALIRDEASDAARHLIDEAERADTIRIELMRCYRQYDEAAHK